MSERTDVVVVGAGPAGSATAYYAARAGLEVTLLDRQDFPRDKPCGDGLMPHAASELKLMGLADWLEEPAHGKFEGFAIYTQTATFRELVPTTLHGPYGYVVPRRETDVKLLEQACAAGADFHGGTRATELLRSPDGLVTGLEAARNGDTERYEAPLVIVADGSGGGFGQGEGLKAHQNAVARRQYFRNVQDPDDRYLQVFMTRDMNERGAGYGWIFYFGDGRANVGAGVSTRTLARSPYTLHEIYDRFLQEPEVARQLAGAAPEGPPKSWSLKMGMWGARRYAQGMLLAGDAGSMVHPISGEGVGYAVESGRLAASWAYEAHTRKDFSRSLLAGYERQLKHQRAREHVSGYALTSLVPRLSMMEPLFKECERDGRLRRTLIESFTGDSAVYSLLKHPQPLARTLQALVRR
jgi:menaquinone-9 beta-reductase